MIEKTLVIIKPDGVVRSLVGEIVTRFERVGLKISALKMIKPNGEIAEKHYSIDPDWTLIVGKKSCPDGSEEECRELGRGVLDRLKIYMSSGPVVAMVIEGAHAVSLVRKLVGGTEPLTSDVGTIRGDFVVDSYVRADGEQRAVRNVIHASSSTDDSLKEIKLWFDDSEIIDYTTAQDLLLEVRTFDEVDK